MSDVSEDGEISEPHDYIIDDDSLDIKPPQNQAGSKHKSGREKHSSERKRRDKHKHRRHESRRQRREHRERRAERSSDTSHRASEALHRDVPASLDAHEHRDREPHDALTHDASHDLLPPPARPSRSHERRESRRERRAERESRKAREQPPPVLESRGAYREAVDESAAPVRDSSRDGRHRAERRDAPATEVDLRRERFLQAMRVSEHQKEMSRRELEARRHRREIEKQRQREQREIELKREREYSDDREGGERRKRSRRVIEVLDEAPDHSLESGDRTRESDRETREREPRDGRERESRADRQGREREPRDGRDREPREGREREPRENRERGARETRERDGRDREREYREGREREPREERTREREGRETDVREDRERLKKVESDHSSAEEEAEEEEEGGEEESEASSSSEEESGEESGDDNEEEEEGEDVTHVSPEGAAPQSRSPTPPVTGRRWRQTSRSSAENGASPRKRSPTHSSPPHSPLVLTAADSPPPSPVELKETLPPYLPAVSGCRNVEEFNCLNRIEEGTYGVVYRAVDKRTKEIVALKRLKMENEKEGFPITSLREINTLLKAQHENIVTVREIVVGSNMDKIYIVMDYVEHDLKSLMQTMKSKKQSFTTGEVKCLLLQMLRAVRHLHDNWILHRDLKTSNLLLSHKGILKVGDFGLAREYGSPLKPYTPVVVTLWYRAPELLLGVKEYACPIDMWSVGCIFGELVRMDPMFPGKSEADQINRIFKELGTPNEKIWPGYSELPAIKKMTFTEYPYNQLTTKLGGAVTDKGVTLMNKLLTYDPKRRLTAEDALGHSYFDEQPRPIEPSMFPTWPAKSEQTHKKAGGNSPKPPSGRKNLGDEDVGFQLGAAAGAGGFSLKF